MQEDPSDFAALDLWDNLEPGWRYIGQYSTKLYNQKAIDIINAHNIETVSIHFPTLYFQ